MGGIGEGGLAVGRVPQLVTAQNSDLALGHVARADLDDDGCALAHPVPTLGGRLAGLGVEQHTDAFTQRCLPRKSGTDLLAIGDQLGIFRRLAQHRDDDDLLRGDGRRHAQAVIVAVGHDHPADQPRRNAPAGGVAELLGAFAILILDAGGMGEIGAEVMRGPRLQRLAVLHHRLDRPCFDRAGETLVLGLLARDHGERQIILGASAVHFERAVGFRQGLFAVLVRSVAFLPEEFAGAQEHPRAHLPAHHIGPLVGEQRQIAPGLHPARHRIADDRFGRGAHHQRLFELGGGIGDQPALPV